MTPSPLGRPRAARRLAGLTTAFIGTLALSGCDVLEDILGAATEVTGTGSAQLTIWTSDPAPSPISVMVNGQTVGTLTHYRNSAPRCGDQVSGAVITIQLQAGQHSISAYETQSTGAWGPSTVTLSDGGCRTYELQP